MFLTYHLDKTEKDKNKEKEKHKEEDGEIIESGIIQGEPLREILTNNLAGIKAFNTFISLSDILQDNNNRLIVIDTNQKLKIFKNKEIQEEIKLNFFPSGLISFYNEDTVTKMVIPLLAISGGNSIFIYKNLKGYMKYEVPDQDVNSEEMFIYEQFYEDRIDNKTCLKKIFDLADRLIELKVNEEEEEENNENNDNDSDNDNENEDEKKEKENRKLYKNEPLSQFTLELLALNTQKAQLKYLDDNKNTKIIIKNYITCINSIYRDKTNDIKSVSYLVIGTENSLIYIINPNEKEPLNKIRIPEVPFLIECQGSYFSDHKIYIADRGCNIYIAKKDVIENKFIIPQPLVNLNITKKNIYVSTIGKNFISYSFIGEKIFSIHQPDYITSMEFYYRNNEDIPISIIALKNNQVRLYNEKKLLMIMHLKDNIFGMKFGQYGINEDCLVLFSYTGSLIIKSFGKDFKFSKLLYDDETNQDEEGKLLIPKKNLLYLDLMDREKDICVNMQNIFQSDLLRLRYKAMDTYVKMLKIGNAPQNYSSSSTMKVSVSLEGLGPNFKLNLILDNSGNEPIFNGILTIDYNRKIYYFDKESIILSIIMPHIPIKYSLNFKNISESGSSGMIKIIILDKEKSSPLIQTTIKVPVSELEML
jgi:hypothetical protein